MNHKRRDFIHIGLSSILTVFLTLCMLTFAALSVVTANSDLNLSKKTAEKTAAYYEADTISRNFVQRIDTLLSDTYRSAASKEAYFTTAADALPSFIPRESDETIRDCTVTACGDSVCISWWVPVSNIQRLSVTLQVQYPKSDMEHFFLITQWQTQTTNEPNDTKLPVYKD